MNKNIRWKLLFIAAVFLAMFAVGIYPMLAQRVQVLPKPGWLMAKQLRLGLDLKGGVHLVMRVETDDALRTHTTTNSEQLREALRTAGVSVVAVRAGSPTTIEVEGVPADRAAGFRRGAE